jgi:hypothetical protein
MQAGDRRDAANHKPEMHTTCHQSLVCTSLARVGLSRTQSYWLPIHGAISSAKVQALASQHTRQHQAPSQMCARAGDPNAAHKRVCKALQNGWDDKGFAGHPVMCDWMFSIHKDECDFS